MAADLVRVRLNGVEKNVGRAFAEAHDLEVLDEPTERAGRLRPTTRAGGRPRKPKVALKKAEPKQDSTEPTPSEDDSEK